MCAVMTLLRSWFTATEQHDEEEKYPREPISGLMQGETAEATQGSINYKLYGNGDQTRPLIVCVHGLMGTMETFRITAERLVKYGYDVLTFDLFGFGLSDSPHKKFDADLFARQTLELLNLLGYPSDYRFALMGFSMGGLVASEITRRIPSRIRRLLLVAPAGLVKLRGVEKFGVGTLRAARALRIPVASCVGKRLFKTMDPDFTPDINDEQKCEELGAKTRKMYESNPAKYSKSWVKSVRDMRLGSSHKLYEGLAASGVEVMFIWGDSDEVVPLTEVGDDLRCIFPQTPVMLIPNAGHGLLHCKDYSSAVASTSARWFNRSELPDATYFETRQQD